MFCHSCQVLAPVTVQVISVQGDSSVCKTESFIRNNQVRVELHLDPEPIAGFTGPEGAVEGKHPGLEFFKSHSADRTGHVRGIEVVFSFRINGNQEPVCFFEGVFAGFHQP